MWTEHKVWSIKGVVIPRIRSQAVGRFSLKQDLLQNREVSLQ